MNIKQKINHIFKVVKQILCQKRKNNIKQQIQTLIEQNQQIDIYLTQQNKRQKYNRTIDWEQKQHIIHWGQRKLFIAELYFLIKYSHLSDVIVYAGSAPGTHTGFLAELFPNKKFYLIDPSEFRLKKQYQNITIINQYFTDELAASFQQLKPLFISDIRSADIQSQSHEEHEQSILYDNNAQMRWIKLMNPVKSILKFRCPYPTSDAGISPMKYFKGEIILQAYCSPTGTETRLIPYDSLEIAEYDPLIYEEQLYYHNHNTRNINFQQNVQGEGLNNSWDILVEIQIIAEFLIKFPQYRTNDNDLFTSISQFSKQISKECSLLGRNLNTKMIRPSQRRKFKAVDHQKQIQKFNKNYY